MRCAATYASADMTSCLLREHSIARACVLSGVQCNVRLKKARACSGPEQWLRVATPPPRCAVLRLAPYKPQGSPLPCDNSRGIQRSARCRRSLLRRLIRRLLPTPLCSSPLFFTNRRKFNSTNLRTCAPRLRKNCRQANLALCVPDNSHSFRQPLWNSLRKLH